MDRAGAAVRGVGVAGAAAGLAGLAPAGGAHVGAGLHHLRQRRVAGVSGAGRLGAGGFLGKRLHGVRGPVPGRAGAAAVAAGHPDGGARRQGRRSGWRHAGGDGIGAGAADPAPRAGRRHHDDAALDRGPGRDTGTHGVAAGQSGTAARSLGAASAGPVAAGAAGAARGTAAHCWARC